MMAIVKDRYHLHVQHYLKLGLHVYRSSRQIVSRRGRKFASCLPDALKKKYTHFELNRRKMYLTTNVCCCCDLEMRDPGDEVGSVGQEQVQDGASLSEFLICLVKSKTLDLVPNE